MKKVLIIAPQFKPIPANFGGVEGLITDLIKENELQKQCEFFVISKRPETPVVKKFCFSKIIYSGSSLKENSKTRKKYYLRWIISKLLRKVTHNKITRRIFKDKKYCLFEDNYFGYYCSKIASKIKPDSIIIFGYDKIHHLWPLVKRIGNKNIYYHLHYCRGEDLKIRELVPNTIATSNYVFNKWNKTHFPNERSTVIRHGIDFEKFNYNINPIKINELRDKLGFSKNDFVIIFTGRFRPGKGIIELLDAFELIKNNHIKLLMLGDFDRKSNTEEEYEQKAIKKIKNNNNIIHLGFVPNDKLSLYYSCADAQVAPTVYEEAAGLVTIEGMLAGLPIIITKSGGMPEYVGDECSFKLNIDADLSKNIASSIITLYKNHDLCKKMGQNSKKWASQFTIANYYNNLLSFLFDQ